MQNYKDSDYALNKFNDGIVYRFADKTVTVTLEDFLKENPSKTENDFRKLKEISDEIYHSQARNENAQTKHNHSFDRFEETPLCYEQSTEEYIFSKISAVEEAELQQQYITCIKKALDKLTAIQRRRYLLHTVKGLTTREIAKGDGVTHQSVVESLAAAKKKIKIFFANS